MGTKPEVMTVRLSETTRSNGYRYAKCRCGRKLHIGKASHVEDGRADVAYCASPKCGITVRITK